MRKLYPTLLVLLFLPGEPLLAQPSLEFAAGGGSSLSGSTLSAQVVTLQNNSNNPLGNTFTTFLPKTTVSFALSDRQFFAVFT